MNRRRLGLIATALLGIAFFAGCDRLPGHSTATPTPLPVATDAPPPSLTAVPAPVGAKLISEDQARDIFLHSLGESERADESSVVVVLGTAGEWRNWGDLAADYPIYRVSASGNFVPFSWSAQAPADEYSKVERYIDATNGRSIGEELSDPHPAPSAASGPGELTISEASP